ncbi:MAG: SPOR domain-containing protein [Magnetococcus sp. DMHC-6]
MHPATSFALAKTQENVTTPPSKQTTIGHYIFNAGSITQKDPTRRLEATLQAMALPYYIEDIHFQNKLFHRFWVGPFNTHLEAENARNAIQKIPGQNPEPVRIDPYKAPETN